MLKKPKHIIELLVDKIILYDDKMEITYKLNNGSPDNTDRDFLFYTENIDSTIISLQYQTAEKSFKIELYC